MNKAAYAAPCGLDCFQCEYFEKNISEETIKMLIKHLGMKRYEAPCKGCRFENGCKYFDNKCENQECVKSKKLQFCFECKEFPCRILQPCSDGAEKYSHNMKVYNLCRMKSVGVKKWAEEESLQIRKSYFKGKFVIGSGPVLPE